MKSKKNIKLKSNKSYISKKKSTKSNYKLNLPLAKAVSISFARVLGIITVLKGINAIRIIFQWPVIFGIVMIRKNKKRFAMEANKCDKAKIQPNVIIQRTLRNPATVVIAEFSVSLPFNSRYLSSFLLLITLLPNGKAA